MICSVCHRVNDDQAKFCDQCGQLLDMRCQACGSLVRPEAHFCSQCGQRLIPFPLPSPHAAAPVPEPTPELSLGNRLDHLQRFLPQHLADKILANRGRLEGERKLVTVLFADIAGYTNLSERVEDEALFSLMDELYELFIHEVHRYEGTVNELTGDGIIAFFGAPLAVEQAPVRAVRAALALQQAAARYSRRLEHERGCRLQVRVGINTGPVIVGTVGNNLRMDYKAVGNTVNLAARMEQIAAPGTIQITAQTYRLVSGYFDCENLGLMSIKGVAEPVFIYRIVGERGMQARIDVARERGFTRLVGRERELDQLRHCFELVKGGSGQAMSIIGEAGLGKSRLLYECRQMLDNEEITWLEGRCSPDDASVAYLPIITVVKRTFRIGTNDSDEDTVAKVHYGLAALEIDWESTAPYVLHLLAPGLHNGLPTSLPPEVIKHRIFEALRLLMLAEAARRPLVLAIEDVHWADQTTTEFVTFLLDHIAGSRLLLVFTHRPEFVSTWSRKSYHSVSTLTRLTQRDCHQMLVALLETTCIQDELVTLVLEKCEGIPFFLEELVKSLQEAEAIALQDGQWRLQTENAGVHIPATVDEVLMARIDRLPDGAKSVLQIGAVIGRVFGWELLKEVSGLTEHELMTHVAELTNAELIYERGLPPRLTYLFKHAFTQEAAYRSLLTTRRRVLHHHVALTLETLFPDRLEEYYGQLAHHFLEAAQEDEMDKAIDYAVRAGDRNMALLAYAEAARFYRMALHALAGQKTVDEEQRCTVLLALGEAQRKQGEPVQALEILQRAADSARLLRSAEHLAQAALASGQTTWASSLPSTAFALRLLQEALQELGETDSALRAKTLGSLARALLFTGAQEQAIAYARQAVEVARRVGDPEVLAFTLGCTLLAPWGPDETEETLAYATEMVQLAEVVGNSELASEAHTRRLVYLLELGHMEAVDAEIEARARADAELQMPAYSHVTTGYRAMRALLGGRFAEGEQLALQAQAIGQQAQSGNTAGSFGVQMFTLCRERGSLKALEPIIRSFMQQHGAASAWRPGLAVIYSELGREQEARTEFEHFAQHEFTNLSRNSLWVGSIVYLTEVCAFLGDVARAATLYQLLLPYAGRTVVVGGGVVCYGAASRYLGMLATVMQRWNDAEQHFQNALAMNAEMGARPWLAHTQHAYAVMLLSRKQPGDHEKTISLLDEALATARELGMRVLEERIAAQMQHMQTQPDINLMYPDDLSQREQEVLHLLAAGKSNREIAETLCISLNTVASHVRNILTKTGTTNRTEAAAYAMRHGLRHG